MIGMSSNKLADQLSTMPDQALPRMAQQYKDDAITLSMILSEKNRRDRVRQTGAAQQAQQPQAKVNEQVVASMQPLPEDVGIGALPAPNMQGMAEGGIVGFADGGQVAFAKGGKPSADAFEQAFQTVLRLEGGAKYVADDAGKGPTKYGINKTANPDVDVKNLTEAQARKIYRERYWDKINGDALAAKDPALATIAFDAAVNQGAGTANKMVAAAGGDPTKLLEMRKQRYDALVQAKPEEYGRFSKGWDTRLASLATAALPLSAAQAAPAPAAAPATGIAAVDEARRAASISQIPGAAPLTQAAAGPAPTGNEIVKGTAKTAYALGQNLLAVPAAGISTLARKAFGDPNANFEETLGRYAYSPDDAVSQQQLAGIGKAMSDLKIPAYIPTVGGVAGASRAGAAKDAAAVAKTQNLRLGSSAAEDAATAALKKAEAANFYPTENLAAVSPESAGVLKKHPDRIAAERAAAEKMAAVNFDAADAARATADRGAATNMANLTADEAAAAAARTRMGNAAAINAGAQTINPSLPAISQRSAGVGALMTGINAANMYPDSAAAGSDVPPTDDAFRRSERESRKVGDDLPKEVKKEAIDIAKEATPKAERKGLTNDDYLTLGLGLLANKSASFGQALGEAGLGTLKFQRERIKDEREAENEAIKNKYYSGLARQAEATAGSYESGSRLLPQAMTAANAAYDDWFKALSPIQQMELKPGQAEAKRQEFLQSAMSQFRIAGSSVDTGGFKMLGSRPSQ